MNYRTEEINGKWIVIFEADDSPVSSDRQMTDAISVLFENGANLALFEPGSLPADFNNLRNGIAGIVMQKLVQYNMVAAAVIDDATATTGRFGELMLEMNKGNQFRTFPTSEAALAWLAQQ